MYKLVTVRSRQYYLPLFPVDFLKEDLFSFISLLTLVLLVALTRGAVVDLHLFSLLTTGDFHHHQTALFFQKCWISVLIPCWLSSSSALLSQDALSYLSGLPPSLHPHCLLPPPVLKFPSLSWVNLKMTFYVKQINIASKGLTPNVNFFTQGLILVFCCLSWWLTKETEKRVKQFTSDFTTLFLPLPVHPRQKGNTGGAADGSLRSPHAALRHKPSEQAETGQQEASRYHSLGENSLSWPLGEMLGLPSSLALCSSKRIVPSSMHNIHLPLFRQDP